MPVRNSSFISFSFLCRHGYKQPVESSDEWPEQLFHVFYSIPTNLFPAFELAHFCDSHSSPKKSCVWTLAWFFISATSDCCVINVVKIVPLMKLVNFWRESSANVIWRESYLIRKKQCPPATLLIKCRESSNAMIKMLINQIAFCSPLDDRPTLRQHSINKIWKLFKSRSSKKAIYFCLSKSSGLMRWNGN